MSDVRKITVTEGLRELKLYDAKIERAVKNDFIGCKKKSLSHINNIDQKVFVDNVKANYQSVVDLIENRRRLKAAIVQSNANTTVEIAGVKYTVAEAIERKNSIIYEKKLLSVMKRQYQVMNDTVTSENMRVTAQLDKMLEAYIGKDGDKKITEADLDVITVPYRIKNEWEMVDPLDLATKIEELEERIEGFESNVDIALSISNSITIIEV